MPSGAAPVLGPLAPCPAALQIRRELIDLWRHHFGPQGVGANHEAPGSTGRRRATGGRSSSRSCTALNISKSWSSGKSKPGLFSQGGRLEPRKWTFGYGGSGPKGRRTGNVTSVHGSREGLLSGAVPVIGPESRVRQAGF